jgi:hypothetical protein
MTVRRIDISLDRHARVIAHSFGASACIQADYVLLRIASPENHRSTPRVVVPRRRDLDIEDLTVP